MKADVFYIAFHLSKKEYKNIDSSLIDPYLNNLSWRKPLNYFEWIATISRIELTKATVDFEFSLKLICNTLKIKIRSVADK